MSFNNSFPPTRHLLAHDFSGSTWNNDKYFNTVKEIYYNSPVPFTDIILWDSIVEKVSTGRYEQILNIKDGDGGTYPHVNMWICSTISIFDVKYLFISSC